MKIFQHKIIPVSLVLIILFACEQDKPIDRIEVEHTRIGNLIVITDPAYLNQGLTYKDELLSVKASNETLLKSAKFEDMPLIDVAKNYVFKLQAEYEPPVWQGNKIQATHVNIDSNYAFVSYNTKGDTYLGSFIIFDVSNIKHPVAISQGTFPDGDYSAVEFHDQKLYLVGASSEYLESDLRNSPAFLQVVQLDNAYQISSIDTIIDLAAYAGTDIKVTDDRIYVTSGTNGGLFVFDHDYNLLFNYDLDDARSVGFNQNKIFVFQGSGGRIAVFDKASFAYETTYDVGGATIPESKTELDVTNDYIYTSLNDGGLKILLPDGTEKQHIPKPTTPPGALDENFVTNSVTFHEDVLLVANGEAGIYLNGIFDEKDDSVFLLGTIAFGEDESSNFVESQGRVIFVATGLGGLKILSVSEDDGLPDDIIGTEPCEDLYSNFVEHLPDKTDNTKKLPELFNDTLMLNIRTTAETDIYVTFIDEIALWKNTFGYYYYDADNPPASINDLEKKIVFPNVSKEGDGGGLEYGDMVRLTDGPFPANTEIGFYLIAQSWRFGEITEGYYTNYTNKDFNNNHYQQHILYLDKMCNTLVMAFEDIRRTDSMVDNDFNDIIFTIKDDPFNEENKNKSIDISKIPVR